MPRPTSHLRRNLLARKARRHAAAAVLEVCEARRLFATFTVTTSADNGPGSLPDAISLANAAPGADTINFNIPGAGVHTIAPRAPLPAISEQLLIDGYSQPGSTANTGAVGDNAVLNVELSGGGGAATANGLDLTGGNITVCGLSIHGFAAADVKIDSSANVIEGCWIGLDASGLASPAAATIGVLVDGAANSIGSPDVADRNVISAHAGDGIQFNAAQSGAVTNAYIGIDPSGTSPRRNGGYGVNILNSAKIIVGLAVHGGGNVISGNIAGGISVTTSSADTSQVNNLVQANFIGTDATGGQPLKNLGPGIDVAAGAGPNTFANNTIAFNGGNGIEVRDVAVADRSRGHQQHITENSIYSNGGLGIDLNADGVTPNDGDDSDNGANGLQNFPMLSTLSVSRGAGGPAGAGALSASIGGTLHSTANGTFILEFYSSTSADVSGFGEGQSFLGSVNVNTDRNGDASFSLSATPSSIGIVTATATDAFGNTSEFSRCLGVAGVIVRNPGDSYVVTAGAGAAETLSVQGGSVEFAADAGRDVSIEVPSLTAPTGAAAASAVFDVSQHIAALGAHSGGRVSLLAGGGKVLALASLAIDASSGAILDLGDGSMILDYSSSALSPLGTWNGTAYDQVTGLIASGRSGGGPAGGGAGGIVSTSSSGNFTALAVAEASQVLGLSSPDTGLFAGQTVDATAVLIKFTYGGDANLDGKINVDDYGHINTSIPLGLAGWFNGDFNYDGKINVDDYGIIDFNVGIQGAPLGASLSATTAPMPTFSLPANLDRAVARRWIGAPDVAGASDEHPKLTDELFPEAAVL